MGNRVSSWGDGDVLEYVVVMGDNFREVNMWEKKKKFTLSINETL